MFFYGCHQGRIYKNLSGGATMDRVAEIHGEGEGAEGGCAPSRAKRGS